MQTQVLIVGAGPTGLVLALWLTKLGVAVRIVDRTAEPGTTSRALAVQARTLELYRQTGLTDAVIERGHRIPGVNLWARGRRVARVGFETVGERLTPFPFLHIFPQDEHERLLIERLAAAGVSVERQTELLDFTEADDRITARLRGPAGETTCDAAFLAGCDGARSTVREAIGGGFPGGAYRQVFYVADVVAGGPAMDGELHVDLDEADFLAIFALAGKGRARLVGTVRDARADHPETMRFEDVSDRAIRNMKVAVEQVNWFSTYHVHHRVTDRFRKGRAFVVGDAAHIHSPAGGQGMNTGIGDAINLAWKLAWVLAGRAPDALLDSYEAERIGFARRLVASTDRAFSIATAAGPLADVLRTRVLPLIFRPALQVGALREFMFRTVSQITLNYRGSQLSVGEAGHVKGGDRLPWVPGEDEPARLDWQARLYGEAPASLARWCADAGLELLARPWREAHAAAGLREGVLYLLRPDTYIGLVDPSPSPAALARYFDARGVALRSERVFAAVTEQRATSAH
ncbi:MAG TPA: FAD-dependent monooxygenase [Caulobacteraceae bacterium]|jgi:2-polyprenyl-6-methoxyphenol hydroxylase-like FAD-dependent oxidoreductase